MKIEFHDEQSQSVEGSDEGDNNDDDADENADGDGEDKRLR